MQNKIFSKALSALSLIAVAGAFVLGSPVSAANVNVLKEGIQFSDLNYGSVMVWSRSNNVSSRMIVEYALNSPLPLT